MEVCGANTFFQLFVLKNTYTSLRPSTASDAGLAHRRHDTSEGFTTGVRAGSHRDSPEGLRYYTHFSHYFVVSLVHYIHISTLPRIKNKANISGLFFGFHSGTSPEAVAAGPRSGHESEE